MVVIKVKGHLDDDDADNEDNDDNADNDGKHHLVEVVIRAKDWSDTDGSLLTSSWLGGGRGVALQSLLHRQSNLPLWCC